jgi:heme/copper-type cytochrome/quinol oxidase subunit 3
MAHAAPANAPAHATERPLEVDTSPRPTVQALPVTPGKVAMWLFLATEVMFFTGLIGTYIVLRMGSPAAGFSNLFSPATDLKLLGDAKGVFLKSAGSDRSKVLELIQHATGKDEEEIEHFVQAAPHGVAYGLPPDRAEELAKELNAAGAKAKVAELETFNWPKPYHDELNPLSIDLTAVNTFILICSSVTMVLGLAAIQENKLARGSFFLLATVLIGSVFLSIQIYEYYQLMFGHHYPPGISATGHFRPSVSLFASCFFTMTGFHGAHVAGGVILMSCITIQSFRGAYNRAHHSPVELAGLYWHFVDLVWIILFTVVYLI